MNVTAATWIACVVETSAQPGYHFGGQFEFGLDLILDALAVRGDATPTA
ncbi:hypothetical protein [Micromonospora chersina]